MYNYCATPLKSTQSCAGLWVYSTKFYHCCQKLLPTLLSAGLCSQNVRIPSCFQPTLPITCWCQSQSLSLESGLISPLFLQKPIKFLRSIGIHKGKQKCRASFSTTGNSARTKRMYCCPTKCRLLPLEKDGKSVLCYQGQAQILFNGPCTLIYHMHSKGEQTVWQTFS